MAPHVAVLEIRVVNEKGGFLGGTVDVEILHRRLRRRARHSGQNAAAEIRVRGPRVARGRWYRVTVTPSTGLPPQSQAVRVPRSGAAPVVFVYPTRALRQLARQAGLYQVSGRVSSPNSASVSGLMVQIVDRNVGGDVALAGGTTDVRGFYKVTFEGRPTNDIKEQLDLQAKVYSKRSFVGASEVRYDARNEETLNVLLPAGAVTLVSEHEALLGAVARNFSGDLRDLKESEDQQDITYLANKTGWDARAVALAALADRFSQIRGRRRAAEGIPAPFYYALFRAGLPANAETLYQFDARTVGRVWKQSLAQGVIAPELEGALGPAVEAFVDLSADSVLTVKSSMAVSPLKDLLATAELNPEAQEKFASLYVENRTDLNKFWGAVSETMGAETAAKLQVTGKLGLLTLNNGPLIQKLHGLQDGGLKDPVQLAAAGLHRGAAWLPLLDPATLIPETIPGDKPEQRLANYAEYLAAQVRLSYPTAAVAHMVGAGELAVEAPNQVNGFLTTHHGQFELGVQPVEQFIARNSLDVPAETVGSIKRLQRVYQLTPSDAAMSALLTKKVDSAYQIVRYGKDNFIRDFAADLGGPEQARLTFDKSAHIHNAVLNLAISFLTAKTGLTLGSPQLSPDAPDRDRMGRPRSGQIVQPEPGGQPSADVIAYPTLEKLFGSMDFCACDHCRSILSPAAYFVDLLNFIDLAPAVGEENPQAVLLERRPDLEHLPLTCENTNTALPYIDIVNETLEYFIANETDPLTLTGYLGHDTGTAQSPDLLASPQFVMNAAYSTLLGQRFPSPLPFHTSLEELRRYFEKLEVPLTLAMERFRVKNTLERGTAPYGWRDILAEEAKISRAEYRIFNDSTGVPLWRLYGFPNGTADADVIAALSNAKDFSRRLSITYEELAEVLRTRFVNPNSNLIPKAEALEVSFGVLFAVKNGTTTPAQFAAMLPQGAGAPDPADYGGTILNWVTDDDNFNRLMGLIVLNDPTGKASACDFGALELRHAKPPADENDVSTRLTAAEFVRIIRLVRLWKRLGWTLSQTDLAICALFNANLSTTLDVDTAGKLDAGFTRMLPRLGIVLRVMKALNLSVERDVASVIALWAPISTHGDTALYREMFLNPTILEQDDAFADNGFGEFLQDPAKKILEHLEGLRAAFTLTGDEIALIVSELDYDANTPLDIGTVSAVYRRGWLARKLGISVRELLLLVDLTDLDPFEPPSLTNPAVLRLATLTKNLKEQGLRSPAALYLFWNQDLSGTSTPDEAQTQELARTLRADFAAIDDQFTVVDDPTGDVLRARMSLVYGPEAGGLFSSLLAEPGDADALEIDVAYTQPAPNLSNAITGADANISYDHFRHRLTADGVFTNQRRQALKALAGPPAAFKRAVDALFDRSQDILASFFGRYPELKPLFDDYVASNQPPAKKRKKLLASFKPELSRRRRRQQALQRLSTAIGVELAFTETLLEPTAAPFPMHAADNPNRPALVDIVALQTQGLAAKFFFRNTATGTVDREEASVSELDYSPGDNPLPENTGPGNNISGIWSGLLEAPESGFFNIAIEADTQARAELKLNGQDVAMTQHGAIWRNTDPIELTAGALSAIEITVERVRELLAIRWETPTRPREVIAPRYLYPPNAMKLFSDAYTRFLKAASIAEGLEITANELAFFATHPDYAIGGDGWLNLLAVEGTPTSATAKALLKPLEALLDFARFNSELSPDDESLLDVLKDPAAATADAQSLLYSLTRWDETSLKDLVQHFESALADLGKFSLFQRVYDAFALAGQMGITAGAVIAATTNEPDANTVRNFQGALRARYAPDDWRDVIQPINDTVRGLRRDALVAYVLHQLKSRAASKHIDTPDKLFEFFLMDVQMEPCMQTSRIRHALSSVQLFIERCFMNLEPRVKPERLNAKQWEWMKRYRVWEANRKVFLFPENWLEPELRDDKSSFFKELEGELLQGDITEDAAVVAILNYLEKLEGVAKLRPLGFHHVEENPDLRTGEVDHVIAVTPGAKRKYFYRRRESGAWTPWEPIKLDIEDTPILPVVWDDRVLLFWVQIMKDGPQTSSKPAADTEKQLTELTTADAPPDPTVKTQAILAWSEYYNGKWQPPKTSEVELPADIISGTSPFARRDLGLGITFQAAEDEERNAWLKVILTYQGNGRTNFLLYNTHASPIRNADQTPGETLLGFQLFVPYRQIQTRADDSSPTLDITYTSIDFTGNKWPPYTNVDRHILEPDSPVSVIVPQHPISAERKLNAPFFMDDARHAFYVRTTSEPKWVGGYFDVGVVYNPGFELEVKIPPMVVQPEYMPPKPDIWGGLGPDPVVSDPSVINQSGILEFVTQDAYIQQGLATSGVVTFDDMQIGPGGGFAGVPALQFRSARRRKVDAR